MRHVYSMCLLVIIWVFPASAQTKLIDKDVEEIQTKAKTNISDFENLLNFISFKEASSTEVQNVIERSFSPSSTNHLFFNKKVILEDDLFPGFNKDNTKDVEADKYLNTLDVLYEKTVDPSIHFTNIQVSNVKKKTYLYVKVYFESTFGSRYKKTGAKYSPKKRVAIIRADKIGYSWQTRILGVTFYDPFQPITSTENDVEVLNTDPYAETTKKEPQQKQPDLSYEKTTTKPTYSTGQKAWNIGLKLGFASSVWVGDFNKNITPNGRLGGVAGMYIRYYGTYNHIGLGADFQYVVKGAKLVYNPTILQDASSDAKLEYIQIPVFVNIFILGRESVKPYINLGYAPAFLLNSEIKTIIANQTETEDGKTYLGNYDGSVILGLGVDFKVSPRNRMMFDIRFDLGVNPIEKEDSVLKDFLNTDSGLRQGSLSISMGYAFGLGK